MQLVGWGAIVPLRLADAIACRYAARIVCVCRVPHFAVQVRNNSGTVQKKSCCSRAQVQAAAIVRCAPLVCARCCICISKEISMFFV